MRSVLLRGAWSQHSQPVDHFEVFLVGIKVAALISFPPAQGDPVDISSNSPDSPCATSADSPSTPADTPDRKPPFADDNRGGVAAGMGMTANLFRMIGAG